MTFVEWLPVRSLCRSDEGFAAARPASGAGARTGKLLRVSDVEPGISTQSSQGIEVPVQPVQCGAATMANMAPVAIESLYVCESKGLPRVRIRPSVGR
jgi:hypothetical protein